MGLRVEGRTPGGRICELVDNSGDGIAAADLERLLGELIASGSFGFRARGAAAAVALDRPEFAHVQIGGQLYRLIVGRYSARIERF